DETALFLHRVVEKMPKNKQALIGRLHDRDALFKGKRVLVVDDDMRNVFAIAKVLEENGMVVVKAADGQKALDALAAGEAPDLVLMDIMMPVMDGYETIRRIREQHQYAQLPILALTAKAMRHDREECLRCGASDYLPKPVEVDRLLSLMRVWLYQ
ncbi:MAG: response regulator, partial [Planctomycetota bacterium]